MKLRIVMMALILAMVASLSACKKEEGTMGKMGKAMDKAAHDTEEAVKEAADEVEDAVEDSKD